jgi:transposase
MAENTRELARTTIGLDLGDKRSHLCVLDGEAQVVEEARIATTPDALKKRFQATERCRIALEVGTHSAWVAKLLEDCGHEVLVANARKLRFICESERKEDRLDAEMLARVARMDPKLLYPIRHRGEQGRQDLAMIRSRDALVRARTRLICHVRGVVKSFGCRLRGCSAASFHRAGAQIPEGLRPGLAPVIETIGDLTRRIRGYDKQIRGLVDRYPETNLLLQVRGVGSLTAACFVLTLEDPTQFRDSRAVGSYLGLRPKRRQSGMRDPEMRISKCGDRELRRLLVQAAHYVLGPFGEDCDLRRWGLKLADRGGKAAKKRAVVAVARKLAVLLHRLWVTGEVYEPLRNAARGSQRAAS